MSDCDFYPRVRSAGWKTLQYSDFCPDMSPRVRILFQYGLKASELPCHVLAWHEAPLHMFYCAALCMMMKVMGHERPGWSDGPFRLQQQSAKAAALSIKLVLHLLLPHLQASGGCDVLRDALIEVTMPER